MINQDRGVEVEDVEAVAEIEEEVGAVRRERRTNIMETVIGRRAGSQEDDLTPEQR